MPEHARLKLHLDADTSRKALHQSLLQHGHDVTRTPNEWIALDASDETQLLASTAQGRAIFTFNVRDFMVLSRKHAQHRGIILAAQQSWKLPDLISALDRLLSETDPESVAGQVFWLRRS